MSILINDTQLNALSGYVNSLSRVSALNVTGFGNQTGAINISGLGSVTVSTGTNNFIYISGSTVSSSADHGDGINLSGKLTTTGATLYQYISDASGNLSTRLYQTGNNIYSNFYLNTNPNNYATSGNLQSTGQNLYSNIIGLSGLLSGNILNTGQTLYNLLVNASGFISSLSRVSSISITGFSPAFTGIVGMSGLGNVTVFTGVNNTILISGASSAGAGTTILNGITGSGSSGYLPKFTSDFSGLINSNIIDSGNQIGFLKPLVTSETLTCGAITCGTINARFTASNSYIAFTNSNGYFQMGSTYLWEDGTPNTWAMRGIGSPTLTSQALKIYGYRPGLAASDVKGSGSYLEFYVNTGSGNYISSVNSGSGSVIMPLVLAINRRPALSINTGENVIVHNYLIPSGFVISGNAPAAFNSFGYSGQVAIKDNFVHVATGASAWGSIAVGTFNDTSTIARNHIGSGSPEGILQAISGSIYTDWYNQTLYMKISGNSTNPYGWV